MAKYQKWLRILVPAFLTTGACSLGGTSDSHYMPGDTTTTTTPPPIGTIAVGPGNDVLGMTIGMKQAPNNQYDFPFHIAGRSWTTPCTILDGTPVAERDMNCTMEAKELDLAFNGVTLKINIPPKMCSYMGFDPYFFYDYQAGQGPDFLSYDVDENGSVIAGSVVAKYGGPSGTDASSVISFDASTPKCKFDHTNDDGPDCCYGRYGGVVRTFNSSSGTFQSTTIDDKWSGKASNCLAGPAVEVNAGTTIDGFPVGFIFFTENDGISSEYTIAPRLGKQLSSVGIANYIVPSDYPLNNPNVPNAYLDPLGDPATGQKQFHVNPFYTVSCFDRAMEVKARIRLQIQEWNLDAEFAKQGAFNADPDTVGAESGFPGSDKNDYLDWKDFGTTFPQKAL